MSGGGSGHSERGGQFIHGAIGFDPRMTLGNASVVHQASGALITGFGHNAHQLLKSFKPARVTMKRTRDGQFSEGRVPRVPIQ